jgi:hypothetical protein
MHRMTRVVALSNSTSFEDAAVMQCFEFQEQLVDIPFGGKKVRLPDALCKASCM